MSRQRHLPGHGTVTARAHVRRAAYGGRCDGGRFRAGHIAVQDAWERKLARAHPSPAGAPPATSRGSRRPTGGDPATREE